jgi:hypothetical protein
MKSKPDDLDTITFAGYQVFTNNRNTHSRYISGGICFIVIKSENYRKKQQTSFMLNQILFAN